MKYEWSDNSSLVVSVQNRDGDEISVGGGIWYAVFGKSSTRFLLDKSTHYCNGVKYGNINSGHSKGRDNGQLDIFLVQMIEEMNRL